MFVFGLSVCDICAERPIRCKYASFGDTFKMLKISRLNFLDA
nr:MAG TPA: hypothetical protein [Caudoviricetes sp.]